MKIYPWLKKTYKEIIYKFKKKNLHHSIIIQSRINIGSNKLIFLLCKRILCKKPINFFSCNICKICKLIDLKNYPEIHIINPEKKKKFIGINTILECIQKIYNTSKFGKKNIIWIPKIHLLTESSVNAFLKILEDPPINTIFFLNYNNNFKLKKTLKSRCIIYNLFPPSKKIGLKWLNKKIKKNNKIDILTALNISENSPILAKKIITGKEWVERKNFFKNIKKSIKYKNLFQLIDKFELYTSKKIYWLCSLILDVIKNYYKKNLDLTNIDQIKIIKIIQERNKIKNLYIIINIWMKCFFRIKKIKKINHKFLIIEPIIYWEKIFNFI
ncbi:MAG: DNA polymerase III subunit delta' [Buchnera aphidicola (Periphyllus lyropictus)]|uniref:DNA polymerase III subunit delta' C-terminal domain-containing protein n=1 Tax=Buchnera aphidicola TaxID=9 RepID=UPI001ECDDDA4|nr:DNA polymerase III subunit delta' C-terminal domain-containing protein [Buchnera aphidicola]NIH16590.1 DNA polymerase III subunit delta' [Buchnera aphidicola (Periphyllus lyropictus)]USS94480.1 DNA polymerase III subunit delta' [Buchnera aphidicola (Periphyllus lyropictus)]